MRKKIILSFLTVIILCVVIFFGLMLRHLYLLNKYIKINDWENESFYENLEKSIQPEIKELIDSLRNQDFTIKEESSNVPR